MGSPVRLAAGQRVWSTGEEADRVAVVCNGAATVSMYTPGGQQQVLSIAAKCSAVGLHEAMEGGARRTEVEAIMPSVVMVVSGDRLRATLERGGEHTIGIARLASRTVRRLTRRIQEVGYGTVEQRLARLLLHLAEEHGIPDARGSLVPIPLNRTRLALLLGCRIETLVRTLKEPPVSSTVTFLREGVLIHDLAEIRSYAAS